MAKRKERLKYIKQTDDGSFAYHGSHYRIVQSGSGEDQADTQKALTGLVAAALAAGVFVIASGFIDAAGANRAFYVILPFLGEVICMFVIWWELVKLVYGKGKLREPEYKSLKSRLTGAPKLLAAFSLVGLAASAVYISRYGLGDSAVKTIAYPVLKALAGGAALMLAKTFAASEWIKE